MPYAFSFHTSYTTLHYTTLHTAMTIDQTVVQPGIPFQKGERSLPEAHRFASTILRPTSHYSNIALSSPHWQLKDLLVSSTYSDYWDDLNYNQDPTFYFPHRSRIFSFKYSSLLANSKSPSIVHNKLIKYSSIKFQSNPRCLKQLDGILVTGGVNNNYDINKNPIGLQKGSFSVYSELSSTTENLQIGEFITNSVSIDKLPSSGSNHYRSYLCNNDKYLYQFDITPSRIIPSANPLYLKIALNHSILSPDKKTQIIVGDSSKIFINHPEESQVSSTKSSSNSNSINDLNLNVIQTTGDCGFSTSFLSNNYQFITCFQDGLALIYDLRNLDEPLHEIHSTRPKTQPGAFRVIKTSGYNDDLIAISEHQGRIHLIDGRNFNNHSVLLLPKYLYNVPPSMSSTYKTSEYIDEDLDDQIHEGEDIDDDNDNDTDNNEDSGFIGGHTSTQMFGKCPIAISTDTTKDLSLQWYNQPIIKDIDDFDDLSQFGGELNLGYAESYRYMDYKYRTSGNLEDGDNEGEEGDSVGDNDGDERFANKPSYRVVLQATLDRENLLQRNLAEHGNPYYNRILTYKQPQLYPVQFRKKRRHYEDEYNDDDDEEEEEEEETGRDYDYDYDYDEEDIVKLSGNTEIRHINQQCWWNQEKSKHKNYKDMWPWGKKLAPIEEDINYKGDYLSVLETPIRDPFFYVDSDIEINGLELANRNGKSTLCVGTKEGLIFWDVNEWKRKCFPCYECV